MSMYGCEVSEMKSGCVMAFDYGARRVGVAVGEIALRSSFPVDTIKYARRDDLFGEIKKLVGTWSPILFIVGLPQTVTGAPHKMHRAITIFSRDLFEKFGLKVCFINEGYSSSYANELLADSIPDWKKRKAVLDSYSAKVILDDFFNEKLKQ